MKPGTVLLAASCALALAACGPDDRPTDADPPSDGTTLPAETAPAPGTPAPVEDAPASTDGGVTGDAPAPDQAPDATADASGAVADDAATGAATVADCSTTIEGNDRMQYNVASIHVPADCSEFTINLKHTGSLPVAAMGHNVVVTTTGDYPGAAADGLAAGGEAGYVQPGDERVIAASDMVGGGESTSVTFSTDSLDADTDYTFFCSFPGHSALMSGSLTFGN